MIPGDSIITATPTVYSMYTHVCDNSVIIKSKLLLSKMQLVIVQWNFFEFNVLEGYSALYGAYSWHWLVRSIPHWEREDVHKHTLVPGTLPRMFLFCYLRLSPSVFGVCGSATPPGPELHSGWLSGSLSSTVFSVTRSIAMCYPLCPLPHSMLVSV